jgi:NAD(P)-dependent dehydrogenase (short-subunit alcohol dehydrogenase family)
MTNDEEQTMAEPDGSFAGKVAFVTGAGSDIGRITALAFAREGANVVVAATDDLTGAGHQALGVLCDVSQEDPVAAMVDRAVATFGRLDMAFNNAGIQAPPTDAANEPAETFDRVNAINLRGVWACMKHELRQMRTQGSGAIQQVHPMD